MKIKILKFTDSHLANKVSFPTNVLQSNKRLKLNSGFKHFHNQVKWKDKILKKVSIKDLKHTSSPTSTSHLNQ